MLELHNTVHTTDKHVEAQTGDERMHRLQEMEWGESNIEKEGWKDLVLIEKGELTSGSTWHAAGLCPHFNGNHSLSKIHAYTIQLYDEILPAKTGLPSSFHKTGSLRVGYTEVEEQWFTNVMSRAHNIGCDMRWVNKEEAKRNYETLQTDLSGLSSMDSTFEAVRKKVEYARVLAQA